MSDEWVSVSERLPEPGVYVLAWHGLLGLLVVRMTERGAWQPAGAEGAILHRVAYWRDAPEPPAVHAAQPSQSAAPVSKTASS